MPGLSCVPAWRVAGFVPAARDRVVEAAGGAARDERRDHRGGLMPRRACPGRRLAAPLAGSGGRWCAWPPGAAGCGDRIRGLAGGDGVQLPQDRRGGDGLRLGGRGLVVLEGVPGVRSAVAFYLNNASDHSVSAQAMAALADDEDPKVRETALMRLVESSGVSDRQRVEGLLKHENDTHVRTAGIVSLGRIEHPWAANLLLDGYISNQGDTTRVTWAKMAVMRAARLIPDKVLRQIATDEAVELNCRLDSLKIMWHRELRSDVVEVAERATSDRLEQRTYHLPWKVAETELLTRSEVEFLCTLLELGLAQDPLEHPLWQAADKLAPNLGIILRDQELRRRFRAALNRFESEKL